MTGKPLRVFALVIAASILGSSPAAAEGEQHLTTKNGIEVIYKFSGWCAMLGMTNENSYAVRLRFEYFVIGDNGSEEREEGTLELDAGEFKGGGHFMTDDMSLENCPWVGEEERPIKLRFRFLEVTNLDAERAREEAEKQRKEEETRRREQEEETARKEEERRQRLEEERRQAERERQEREQAERERQEREQAERERQEREQRERRERARALQEAEEERQQAMSDYASTLASSPETDASFGEGIESRTNFSPGFGFAYVPLIVNETEQGNGATERSAEKQGAFGTAITMQLDYWPVTSDHFDLGILFDTVSAGMTAPGVATYYLSGSAGVGTRIGFPSVSLVGELTVGYRLAGFSHDSTSLATNSSTEITSSGRLSDRYLRYTGGLRYAWDDREAHMDLLLNVDRVGFDADSFGLHQSLPSPAPVTVTVRLFWMNLITATLEMGTNYPVGGRAEYPADEELAADRGGLFMAIHVAKSFDFVSDDD